MSDLVPSWIVGELDLTDYPFSVAADSTVDIGEPEMVVESVESALADGEIERIVRYGNRTYTIPIYIEGSSLAEIAQSEALLRSEMVKPNLLLTHDPGDGLAPVSVYQINTARLTPSRKDDHEGALFRPFTLTFTCAPTARSAEITVATALAIGGGTNTIIDTCDSTTGWTGRVNGGTPVPPDPAWLGAVGQLFIYDLGTPGPQTLSLTRTGTFSVSSTPYLRVSVSATQLTSTWCDAVVDGVSRRLRLVSQQKSTVDDDLYDFIWSVPAGSSSISAFTVSNYSTPDAAAFGVAEVERLKGPSSAARQVTRVLEVGGTERAPASLHAYTSSGFLGNTILHTKKYDETGYTPDLSRWRVSGNTTSANVSSRKITGTWQPLQPNPFVASLPATQLPRGDYILMAAIKSSLTGERAISWAVKSLLVSSVLGNVTGTAYYNFPVADRLEFVQLGVLQAPVVRSEGFLNVEVHLSNPSPGSVTLNAEEAWLFTDDEESALTIIGTDEGELWIESPDVTSAVPRYWVGNANGRFHPNSRLGAPGDHRFTPGMVQVTSISDSNDFLEVDLSMYEHWHSNAAR